MSWSKPFASGDCKFRRDATANPAFPNPTRSMEFAMRAHTAARIRRWDAAEAASRPREAQLDFRLAHARARDAVLAEFDPRALAEKLGAPGEPVHVVESAARDRAEFLQRPDLGRRLADASRALLAAHAANAPPCELVIIVSDGLSTLGRRTPRPNRLLTALRPLLRAGQLDARSIDRGATCPRGVAG